MIRHALRATDWILIRDHFPKPSRTGRPPRDTRTVLEGVLWILATGAPWRDLPDRFGPWQTVYGRFGAWVTSGVFDAVLRRLKRGLLKSRRLDLSVWCVDTTVIRASRSAAGARSVRRDGDHALGRSRGGYGTKLALVCDGRGHPLAAVVGPGQQHDLRSFVTVVTEALALARPRQIVADKAYSVAWVRAWTRRRRVRPVIPTRCDQPPDASFDRAAYRGRNVVERLVGWLKESRRVATRYEKLATRFLAFVKLAMIRRLLRQGEFPDRT